MTMNPYASGACWDIVVAWLMMRRSGADRLEEGEGGGCEEGLFDWQGGGVSVKQRRAARSDDPGVTDAFDKLDHPREVW